MKRENFDEVKRIIRSLEHIEQEIENVSRSDQLRFVFDNDFGRTDYLPFYDEILECAKEKAIKNLKSQLNELKSQLVDL